MTSSKSLQVAVVVLIATLLLSSTLAAFYVFQYNQAENDANLYLSELRSATHTTTQTTTTTVVNGGQTTTITSAITGTGGFAAKTNILINFENGTQIWYNGTTVQPGWNLYEATVLVTGGNMNTTWYPSYGEHLVTAIDGVVNTNNDDWFLWTYNSTSLWQVAQVGADKLPTTNGSIFAWSYCGMTSSYTPTCAEP